MENKLTDYLRENFTHILTCCNNSKKLDKFLLNTLRNGAPENMGTAYCYLLTNKNENDYQNLSEIGCEIIPISQTKLLLGFLQQLEGRMYERYELLSRHGYSCIDDYNKESFIDNKNFAETVFIIIDDFKDLLDDDVINQLTYLVERSIACNFYFILNCSDLTKIYTIEDLYENLPIRVLFSSNNEHNVGMNLGEDEAVIKSKRINDGASFVVNF